MHFLYKITSMKIGNKTFSIKSIYEILNTLKKYQKFQNKKYIDVILNITDVITKEKKKKEIMINIEKLNKFLKQINNLPKRFLYLEEYKDIIKQISKYRIIYPNNNFYIDLNEEKILQNLNKSEEKISQENFFSNY